MRHEDDRRAGLAPELEHEIQDRPRPHRQRARQRTLYALRFLGGVRPGEAAAARWKHVDRSWTPLRKEKGTKTEVDLNIPVHPVLEGLLEVWWDSGWKQFMGCAHVADDLIFPREDGEHRRTHTTYKRFLLDLDELGMCRQRQYETRSTFRNLALVGGASELHVNLITHPPPKKASDHSTRIDMQWPKMCVAVTCIDPAARDRTGITLMVTGGAA